VLPDDAFVLQDASFVPPDGPFGRQNGSFLGQNDSFCLPFEPAVRPFEPAVCLHIPDSSPQKAFLRVNITGLCKNNAEKRTLTCSAGYALVMRKGQDSAAGVRESPLFAATGGSGRPLSD